MEMSLIDLNGSQAEFLFHTKTQLFSFLLGLTQKRKN